MTKLEAIKALREYDHYFLTPEGVRELGEPFGVYATVRAQDNRSEFKGLALHDAKEGDVAEGLAAHTLAELICQKIGVEYLEMYGIGSQLRACCDAAERFLSKQP